MTSSMQAAGRKKGRDKSRHTKTFNQSVIAMRGPIATLEPLNGKQVRGAELIAFDHGRLNERDYDRLSMGLKPSGEIHMGTVATILNGMLYLVKHRTARLKIDIMDQDYDNQRGKAYWSFMAMPDSENCHGLMKEHTLESVRRVVEKLAGIIGIDPRRVTVSYFTDNYACEGFPELMQSLMTERLRSKQVKYAIFDMKRKWVKVPFTPICTECGHSNTYNGRINLKEGTLSTTCYNEGCENEGQEYSVPIADPRAYNVHFLIDPIRDVHQSSNCERADIHLFGGDYLWVHGQKKKTRVQRSADVMTTVTEELPDFFVGPLLTLNGLKMSKSLGAEPADEHVADHIYTRLAEMLSANKTPTIDVWDVVMR